MKVLDKNMMKIVEEIKMTISKDYELFMQLKCSALVIKNVM